MNALSMVGRYERVTFRPPGERAQTVYLRDPVLSRGTALGDVLSGIQVNVEGEEVSGRGFDERRRIISDGLIEKRVVLAMDNYSGHLTEAPPCAYCGDGPHPDNSVPGFPGHAYLAEGAC